MKTAPETAMLWLVAAIALVLATLGLDPGRPMVADLDLPERAASK